MRFFYKLISYIFHPLFAPIAATLLYFKISPKYYSEELKNGNIFPIFILTVVIPVIAYYILKKIGLISAVNVPNIKERKYPFAINIIILLLILIKVIPANYIPELYYFFLGYLSAMFASLLLLFYNFKSSIHLMSITSVLMFFINLSIHYQTNFIFTISAIVLITGLIATSRLYLKTHTVSELLVGFSLGILSQFLTIKFWF